jgi:hypothetical protein
MFRLSPRKTQKHLSFQKEYTQCKVITSYVLNLFFSILEKPAGGVAQPAACLPSKPEALSSNPSTIEKKERKEDPFWQNSINFLLRHT